jgi:hypothetical protein
MWYSTNVAGERQGGKGVERNKSETENEVKEGNV